MSSSAGTPQCYRRTDRRSMLASAWRSCGKHVRAGINAETVLGFSRLCSTRLYAVAAEVDERRTNGDAQAYGASKIQVRVLLMEYTKSAMCHNFL